MEEEFFNINFEDATKLGILTPENSQENDKINKIETKENEEVNQNPPEDTETTETKEVKEVKENEEVKDNQSGENPNDVSDKGSPNNISSSIAFTLADNGVLQTLDKERLKKVNTTEDLIEAFREDIDSRVDSQLTEVQKRVNDALNAGLQPNKIQQYEQVINSLDQVTDETIEKEGEQYEDYRKNLIYQNYIAKGFDEDDAREMVERSIESGNDVNDAKKALASLKKFYKNSYDKEVEEGKKEQEKFIEKQKKQLEELETSIMNDDDFYSGLDVSKNIRKKIYETVTKPIKLKDGSQLTEIQKYMREKPNEALKMFGTMYVLTEGFTKLDGVFKGAVKKQVRESNKNLERLLNQTYRTDGSLNFKSGLGAINDTEKIVGFDI